MARLANHHNNVNMFAILWCGRPARGEVSPGGGCTGCGDARSPRDQHAAPSKNPGCCPGCASLLRG